MFTRQVFGFFSAAVVSALATGCTSSDIKASMTGRWGPDPALPATEVSSVSSNQTQVLKFIIQDAREAAESIGKPADGKPTGLSWFDVTEWGFNIGRQDCEVYLNSLFRMNREKQRNDSVLTALSTATAGILTAATNGQKALSIAAAAFGMTTALNDALFQSFLYTESPGLVANKVKEAQDAYKATIEKNQFDTNSHNNINSAADAYNAIRGFYHICLPQSIEGMLLQAVANTEAKTSDPGTSPTADKGLSATSSKDPKVSLTQKK
jgi:hypothetical protein